MGRRTFIECYGYRFSFELITCEGGEAMTFPPFLIYLSVLRGDNREGKA